MARVFLILPHLPQRMGTPYLGQQYIASSLLAAGHEVRALDLAATHYLGTEDEAVAEIRRWAPDLVGMTLFTYNAARAYRLVDRLSDVGALTVAGGPHPTVCPDEPLEHGFDFSVAGEGELIIGRLASAAAGQDLALGSLPGLRANEPERWGIPTEPRPYETIADLDALPFPLESYGAWPAALYRADGAEEHIVPGGLMTSRGCPARCTFCANYVTGRAFRWRSPENIVAEMCALRERLGVTHFPFWDDAFTARRPRLVSLCEAIIGEPRLAGVTWTCITPGNMVKPRDLELMRRAGCVAVNFGIESGDPAVLRTIQKGQRPEHIKAAVKAAKACGMITIVNFMFGFPGEGVEAIGRTRALMEEIADSTDFFNNRGVLVPFPGTAIYDRHHEAYGFTAWWLDPQMIPDEPNINVLDPLKAQAYLEHDPTLDLDFFDYGPAVREAIEDCVRFKARHNVTTMGKHHEAALAGLRQNAFSTESPNQLRRGAAASLG